MAGDNKKREKGKKSPIFAQLNGIHRQIGGALHLVNDRSLPATPA
jgi:hypothetical protein